MGVEVSSKSLLVLVLVAVIISVLSTLLVLNAVYTYEGTGSAEGEPSGRLTMNVPAQPAASGRVVLTVVDRDEQK